MWVVAFVVLTYLITGVLWLPIALSRQPLATVSQGPFALVLFGATIVPSVVAVLLAAVEGGWGGVAALLRQGGRWHFGPGWYALAILLVPFLWAVAFAVGSLLGLGTPELHLDFLIPLAAIGEEFGWRGYALPRLQPRLGALPAGLLIGVIWAAWHLPYYAFPEVHPLPFGIDFSLFVVEMVSYSVLATWIYNSTGRSVLATMIFHHSIHVASIIPVIPTIGGGVVMAVVTVAAAGAAIVASGGALVGAPRRRRESRSVVPVSG